MLQIDLTLILSITVSFYLPKIYFGSALLENMCSGVPKKYLSLEPQNVRVEIRPSEDIIMIGLSR